MTSIAGLARVRWLPYALIGGVVFATSVFGYGYMKGYSSAKDKYEKAASKALKAHMKENQKLANKDMSTLNKTMKAEQEVENAIDNVTLPDIPPECFASFHEWMQSFNDAVRATNGDIRATD